MQSKSNLNTFLLFSGLLVEISDSMLLTTKFPATKRAFTCNRDEISSWDETCPGMKKFLFTREFHSRMKFCWFHPFQMKFNLKENLPLSMMKT